MDLLHKTRPLFWVLWAPYGSNPKLDLAISKNHLFRPCSFGGDRCKSFPVFFRLVFSFIRLGSKSLKLFHLRDIQTWRLTSSCLNTIFWDSSPGYWSCLFHSSHRMAFYKFFTRSERNKSQQCVFDKTFWESFIKNMERKLACLFLGWLFSSFIDIGCELKREH